MVCCYIEQLGLVLVVLLTVNTTEIHLLVRRVFVRTRFFFVRVVQQPNCGLGRLIVKVSRSETDTQPIRLYLWSPYRKVVIVLEIFVAVLIIYKHIVCISVTSTLIYFNTVRNKVKWAVFCFENRM